MTPGGDPPTQPRRGRQNRRGGWVIQYAVIVLVLLCAFGSLGVDLGRVQLAKAQLQGATDAAARYAAVGLRSTMLNTSAAIANASAVLAQNQVDGQPAPFNSATDIQLGIWTPATKTFVPTAIVASANAVRISTSLTMGTGTHQLTFLSMFGKSTTIHAVAVAMISGHDASTAVSAKGNAWLAGMPAGTVSTDFRSNSAEWDTAGTGPNDQSSPASIALSTLGVAGGATMTFDGVTGGTNFAGAAVNSNADGDSTQLCTLGSPSFNNSTYLNSPTNGMSNCYAPVNAMMAVFLDDNVPNSTAAPSPLNFSTAASRNFTSLSPALKQVFFVGDGRQTNGEIQQFVIPPGATRLFIANMDGWQYNNNVGGYNLSVHATDTITSVYAK